MFPSFNTAATTSNTDSASWSMKPTICMAFWGRKSTCFLPAVLYYLKKWIIKQTHLWKKIKKTKCPRVNFPKGKTNIIWKNLNELCGQPNTQGETYFQMIQGRKKHINRKQIWKNGNPVYLSGGYTGCSLIYSFSSFLYVNQIKSQKKQRDLENTHSQNLDLGLSFSHSTQVPSLMTDVRGGAHSPCPHQACS